ncbi:hypothetical protein ACWGH4_06955 [Streptomyces sp. NPDC054847]
MTCAGDTPTSSPPGSTTSASPRTATPSGHFWPGSGPTSKDAGSDRKPPSPGRNTAPSGWAAAEREAYANDQGSSTSLVAVTAGTYRSEADQEPAEWLPSATDQYCRYVGEWIGTKLRWGLAVEKVELEALKTFADTACEEAVIDHQPAQ